MITSSPRIGVSACMWEGDPSRKIFNGRPLLYLEESMVTYLQSQGALVYLIPPYPAGEGHLEQACQWLDGLVLQGGVDMSPSSYGEQALKPEWAGDRRRDDYEIELIRKFHHQKKPILGICRGLQVINVAFGGSLYQDIETFHPEALIHRNAQIYEKNYHTITFRPNSLLSSLFPGLDQAKVNSVHHQAIKDLGKGLVVEAHSCEDGIIEAIRLVGDSKDDPFCYGVQWHPEFQNRSDHSFLSAKVLLSHFMDQLKQS